MNDLQPADAAFVESYAKLKLRHPSLRITPASSDNPKLAELLIACDSMSREALLNLVEAA